LATAATDGDPSTSPFHEVLREQNSQGFLEAEAFLEAGGNEVTAALLQVVGDFDGRDPILQQLARKAGTYVKQLEQFEAHMTWSKDRIEAISKQVAEAKDSSMTWQLIAERTRKDLLATRSELLLRSSMTRSRVRM
jgi:hypothetical protein